MIWAGREGALRPPLKGALGDAGQVAVGEPGVLLVSESFKAQRARVGTPVRRWPAEAPEDIRPEWTRPRSASSAGRARPGAAPFPHRGGAGCCSLGGDGAGAAGEAAAGDVRLESQDPLPGAAAPAKAAVAGWRVPGRAWGAAGGAGAGVR